MNSNIFIVFLVLFEFTVYMANDLIMPGMLKVVQEFHSQEELIPLSLSLYLLGGMLLQFIIGPVSDKVGRRPTMIAGSCFFLFCTFIITLSPSMTWFLFARFFQGMGLCFIGVCGYASVQELFEEKQAVRIIAWMSAVSITAPILGPILGGVMTQALNWRWIFVFTLICSVITTIGIWKFMPESVQGIKRLPLNKRDLISRFQRIHFQTFKTFFNSYREILTHRRLILGGCVNGLLAAPILCWIAISPIVLFKYAKISPELYGAVQIPIFGCFILGNFVLRRLTYKYSLTQIIQFSIWFCYAGLFSLVVFTHYYPDSYWSLVWPLSLFCFGTGVMGAPVTRISLFSTPAAKGIASAVFNVISNFMQIIAISVMPIVFRGNNSEFGLFCLGCGILTAILLRSFLQDRVPASIERSLRRIDEATLDSAGK